MASQLTTLNISEDGWGMITFAPREDPRLHLSAKMLSMPELRSMMHARGMLQVDRVTFKPAGDIPGQACFGFVQNIEDGWAFYGTSRGDILENLHFVNAPRKLIEPELRYVDILDGLFGCGSKDHPGFRPIREILLTLGSQWNLVLQDEWTPELKTIDLTDTMAVENYLIRGSH
jgi:hypothetical protein